jgi:hypothetical protein
MPGMFMRIRPKVVQVVKYSVDQSASPHATLVVWAPVAIVPRCVPVAIENPDPAGTCAIHIALDIDLHAIRNTDAVILQGREVAIAGHR